MPDRTASLNKHFEAHILIQAQNENFGQRESSRD